MTPLELRHHEPKHLDFIVNGKAGHGVIHELTTGFQVVVTGQPGPHHSATMTSFMLTDEMIAALHPQGDGLRLVFDQPGEAS